MPRKSDSCTEQFVNARDFIGGRSSIAERDCVIARYQVRFPNDATFESYTTRMLLETTTGAFIAPSSICLATEITDFRSLGCILQQDLVSSDGGDQVGLVELAIPLPLCGVLEGLPALLSTLLYITPYEFVRGLRLLDVTLPKQILRRFPGPKFGIEGIRDLLGVRNRPLLGFILKPRLGATPHDYGAFAYEACLGGMDYVLEDELLCDWPPGALAERCDIVAAAVTRAAEETGEQKAYFANITGAPTAVRRAARTAIAAGASGFHLNALTVGFGAAQELIRRLQHPVLVSKVGRGVLTRSTRFGIASELLCKLSRLVGGDAVYTGSLGGLLEWTRQDLLRTANELQTSWGGIKPAFAISSGKTSPGTIHATVAAHGNDVMLQFDAALMSAPGTIRESARVARQVLGCIRYDRPESEVSQNLWSLYRSRSSIREVMDHFGWKPPTSTEAAD